MNQYKLWSNEEEQLCIELKNQGLSNKDIGFRIGRTRRSVWKKLEKLGQLDKKERKPRRVTEEKIRAYQFRNDKEKTSFEVMLAAITSVEQALDSYVLTKDKQSHVHIS
ncbi:hypothetical protein [Nitrosomonas sp.]|uniref:hypothetical protein n=1 Tax=Nitrosomonas sp. TaxID=42353 RepID=UPI0037C696B0